MMPGLKSNNSKDSHTNTKSWNDSWFPTTVFHFMFHRQGYLDVTLFQLQIKGQAFKSSKRKLQTMVLNWV